MKRDLVTDGFATEVPGTKVHISTYNDGIPSSSELRIGPRGDRNYATNVPTAKRFTAEMTRPIGFGSRSRSEDGLTCCRRLA